VEGLKKVGSVGLERRKSAVADNVSKGVLFPTLAELGSIGCMARMKVLIPKEALICCQQENRSRGKTPDGGEKSRMRRLPGASLSPRDKCPGGEIVGHN
jgi:hypothetical protein